MDFVGRNVLVIDPDPIARRIVVDALLSWGADVVEAATAAGAERVDRPMDAIVVSLCMSDSRCRAMVEQLRARWPGVPVIANSVVPQRHAHVVPTDNVVVLPKPVAPQTLRRELESRLSA